MILIVPIQWITAMRKLNSRKPNERFDPSNQNPKNQKRDLQNKVRIGASYPGRQKWKAQEIPNSIRNHPTKFTPASTPASTQAPPQETSELQARPSPGCHQRPRAFLSSIRNQWFNSPRPRSGEREPVLPRVQSVVLA
ncbi:hypothetical protein F2Q70_00011931 [Brassica cretica]|uniref:Uncharacterized protein n=1 Tax=Brassica cretica TaxID=69181 RepID=A0A8S9LPZ4_BRACR|nr:hypothetical protein F2Q70_00011931 [Brassica cretica]